MRALASSRDQGSSQASSSGRDAVAVRPPSYGIEFVDRSATRISDPDEPHERDADHLARSFLATHPSSTLGDTPAAFGRFVGSDLSSVRVHQGSRVDASARALGTGAFSIGDDIGIAHGRASASVLAHELAHVVAQRSRPDLRGTLWREPPKDEEELRKQKQTAVKPPEQSSQAPAPDKPPSEDEPPVPFVHGHALAGLPGDLFNRTLTTRHPSLRPNGSEWYGAWALGWSGLNPLMQPAPVQGGDATPGKWTHDFTRFTKYASSLYALTPGKGDPFLDTASLLTGTRVEDWLGDRFVKQGLPEYWPQLLALLMMAQGAYSTGMVFKEPDKPGTMASDPVFSHFGLLQTLGNAALKSKFLTLGNNPLGVGVPIGNEAALPMTGPLSTGLPPAGLTLDFQKGVDVPGSRQTFGMPFNIGRLIAADEAGKPKSPLELGVWGGLDFSDPTPAMVDAGAEPYKTWSVGAHGGYDWLGGLNYRFRQTGGMQMHQGDVGLGYMPREPKDALRAGPVSFPRFGITGSYANWRGANDSVYGPRVGQDAGGAARVSPFLDVDFNLGKGFQLSVGGQASAAFHTDGADPQRYLEGLRLMIALQHLAPGSPDADKKRLEVSYSQNNYEWYDPKSPLMHALQVKGQWGPWFGGAQANLMQGGLANLQGGPYARDFAMSPDPLRDLSLLFLLGYRFAAPKYPWGLWP